MGGRKFRKDKIPDFILISTGKMHDVNAMDYITWEAGCWYVMDRGYLDFERLYIGCLPFPSS